VTTKVHAAIKKRAGLDEALREQPWAINTVDESGFSPLQLAILEGQVPVMEVLISAGANVEQQMYDGISVLRLAALSGNPEAVTVLLKAKCSANVADREGGTALYSAVAGGNEEVIRLLLMAGASATHRSAWGSTPLHRLGQSMQANCDVIKSTIDMLVMAGADLEAKDEVGDTPIACAIRGDNVRAVRCLVEAGSSLSSYGFYPQNLLHCASAFASLDMLECLCGLGLSDISPYQKDYRGFTPWDFFIFTHVANEWQLRGHRKPTPAEQMAFVELFQGVRDRYLQHDICILEHILSAMRKQDVTAAREGLALLIGRETNWECHDRASWYRAVDKRVQHMEWDLAMEDVEDFLVDMKKELDTPVWKFPSFWGAYLWGKTMRVGSLKRNR
jgi:ankyrin repeat protein